MATLDLLIIAAYLAGMVAVGFWTRRKAVNQEEFLVAGRSVGPLLYSGTLAAIIIGGGATVGGVKLGYTYGISGMWLADLWRPVGECIHISHSHRSEATYPRLSSNRFA